MAMNLVEEATIYFKRNQGFNRLFKAIKNKYINIIILIRIEILNPAINYYSSTTTAFSSFTSWKFYLSIRLTIQLLVTLSASAYSP